MRGGFTASRTMKAHRIASRCYFRALANAPRLTEETDPGGPAVSLIEGEDAGGWEGRRGGPAAVLFSGSPRYPEHNERYPSRLFRGYIVSVLRASRPRMEMQ